MSGEGGPGVDPFGLVGSTLAGKFRVDRKLNLPAREIGRAHV